MPHVGLAGRGPAAGDLLRLDAASRAFAATAARMDSAVRRLDEGARRLERTSLGRGLARPAAGDGLFASDDVEGLAASVAGLGSALADAEAGFAALDAGVVRTRDGLVELGDSGVGALDGLGDAARSMGGALAGSLTDALVGTRSLGDGLERLETRLLRIASRRLVEPLLDRVFGGLLGAVTGGLFGAPSLPLAGGGRAASGLDFEVRGAGGIDSQLVAFLATPGERVVAIPPGREPVAGGVNVTVNVQTSDAGSFRRSAAQVMTEARRAADRAFARNG